MTYTSILQINDRLFQCPPHELRGGPDWAWQPSGKVRGTFWTRGSSRLNFGDIVTRIG